MDLIARFVIVPLTFASLPTGLIQSLGTPWGLFRHYWVLMKLVVTVFATRSSRAARANGTLGLQAAGHDPVRVAKAARAAFVVAAVDAALLLDFDLRYPGSTERIERRRVSCPSEDLAPQRR
jgi:hypothetical protein